MEADHFRSAPRTRPFNLFAVQTARGRTVLLAYDEGYVVLDMASITGFVRARPAARQGAR